MPFESLPVFACDRIPKENDSANTPTGERTPIRTERYVTDPSILLECLHLCACNRIPETDGMSRLPLASVPPSGLNAMEVTLPVCPSRVCPCSPVTASHRWIVPSQLPLAPASVPPSGLAMKVTLPVCPSRVCPCSPVTASHRWIVPSQLPLASVPPSGLNATLWTSLVCPVNRAISAPVYAS